MPRPTPAPVTAADDYTAHVGAAAPQRLGAVEHSHLKMTEAAPSPLTAAEMITQNEALIARSAAALKADLQAKGVSGADVGLMIAIDITGKEVQICLACAIEGHDFQPSNQRQDSPAINMLGESMVVGMEIARRVGIDPGLIIYDEEVFVVREPGDTAGGPQRDLDRFEEIFARHGKAKDLGEGEVLDWMTEEGESWTPEDATRRVVGDPDDRGVFEQSIRLLDASGKPIKGMMLSKGQPQTNVRSLVPLATAHGVTVTGIAVGEDARQIAAMMPRKTLVVPDTHDVRSRLGPAISEMVPGGKS
jgi:hypothetical protein